MLRVGGPCETARAALLPDWEFPPPTPYRPPQLSAVEEPSKPLARNLYVFPECQVLVISLGTRPGLPLFCVFIFQLAIVGLFLKDGQWSLREV